MVAVALLEVIALEHAGDGVATAKCYAIHERLAVKPLAVLTFLDVVDIENRADLVAIGLLVCFDLLASQRRPGLVAPTRVTNHRRSSTPQHDDAVARRSSSSWMLTTTGIQGHSSQIFKDELGYGAIFEAARIVNAFREELVGEEYLSFNPGTIVGGTDIAYDPVTARGTTFGKTNVVSQAATVHGGIRTISTEQLDKAITMMKDIASQNLPGTTAKIEFKTSYPPMAPTKQNYVLLDKLESVNVDLGYGKLEPLDPGKRGAADISFVAPHVDASLAGMGPDGFGEHSEKEGLDLTSFPKTTTRAAILIYRLTR